MYNSMPICRVCLKESLDYIDFETPFNENSTYLDCFRRCTQLDVDFDVTPPHSLCHACGLELKIAYDFLQKAEQADRLLQQEAMIKTELCEFKREMTDCDDMKREDLTQEDVEDFEEFEQLSENELLYDEPMASIAEEQQDEVENVCKHCSQTFHTQSTLNLHTARMHSQAQPETDLEPCISTELEDGSSNGSKAVSSNKEEHEVDVFQYSSADENTQVEMIELNDGEYEDAIGELLANSEHIENTTALTLTKTHQERSICQNSIAMETHSAAPKESATVALPAKSCSYTRTSRIRQHPKAQRSVQAATPTNCKICHQKVAGKADGMREHLQEVHSAIVQCSQCNYKGKESRLPEHYRRVHAEQRDFLCNVCSKTFTSSGLLNAHLKNHERRKSNAKSDACEVCGKQFSTQHYLRQHMDVHRDERELHQCTQCDKIYFSKTALENHMRVHTGDKVVECPWCGKIFARQYELSVHKRFHTLDYPFACEVCGKKFAIKGHLRTHMWRHQGLKLQCEECGKLFTSTKALSEHSYSHTEMPFPCSYCAKGYPSKQKYKMHLKNIHLIDLTEEELQKVAKAAPKPLLRKKLTLVQADSIMKEVEIKSREEEHEDAGVGDGGAGGGDITSEIIVELC